MKVSVIMTAWNTARWIDAALASVTLSSHTDLDIVVVDDGSKDATADICAHWAGQDERIRFVLLDRHVGRNAALKEAHDLAVGDVLCWVDSDDLVHHDGISRAVAALDADHQLAATRRNLIDVNGRDLGIDRRFNSGDPLMLAHAFFHLRVFTAEVFAQSGGVGDKAAAIDLDMNLRMAEHTAFRRVNESLYWYRQRPGRMSDGQLQGINAREAMIEALERRGIDGGIVWSNGRWRVQVR